MLQNMENSSTVKHKHLANKKKHVKDTFYNMPELIFTKKRCYLR